MFYQQNVNVQYKEQIVIHRSLSEIYSDIEGELCSKQSTLLNKLKNKFSTIYDGLIPTNFIMLNHIASLTNGTFNIIQGKDITFAMENGIILLVKNTYQAENIFINSQSFEKQMEFSCQGKIIQLDNFKKKQKNNKKPLQKQIQQVIELVTDQLSINRLFGGVIYIYSNIKQNVTFFKQKLLLGIYLALLIINNQLKQLSIQQIYVKLLSKKNIFSQVFLQKQLLSKYQKRKFSIQQSKKSQIYKENHNLINDINLQKMKKLVFMDTRLGKQDIQKIKQNKTKINLKMQSLQESNKSNKYDQQFKQTSIKIDQFFTNIETNKNNNIIQKTEIFFKSIKQITSFLNIYPKQLIQALQLSLKDIPNLSYLIIQQGQYIVFCVNSYMCLQLIKKLRHIFTFNNQQNPEIIQKRFDQRIFTCVPTVALAILNPEDEIWFK